MAKKKTDVSIRSSAAEYLTFVAATGESDESVEMRYEDENIWLTQKMMAVLYDVTVPTVNYHINKIFKDHELERDSVIRKILITAEDGKDYLTNHYGLSYKEYTVKKHLSPLCVRSLSVILGLKGRKLV